MCKGKENTTFGNSNAFHADNTVICIYSVYFIFYYLYFNIAVTSGYHVRNVYVKGVFHSMMYIVTVLFIIMIFCCTVYKEPHKCVYVNLQIDFFDIQKNNSQPFRYVITQFFKETFYESTLILLVL